MNGTHADLDELGGLASKLRNAGSGLDGSAAPPPAPDVGVATEAVAAAMALLTSSAAGIAEGVGAAGDAVAQGRDLYDETEQSNADMLGRRPR